jgi:hypothetical protein
LDQVTGITRILMMTSWPSPTRTTFSELPLA